MRLFVIGILAGKAGFCSSEAKLEVLVKSFVSVNEANSYAIKIIEERYKGYRTSISILQEPDEAVLDAAKIISDEREAMELLKEKRRSGE